MSKENNLSSFLSISSYTHTLCNSGLIGSTLILEGTNCAVIKSVLYIGFSSRRRLRKSPFMKRCPVTKQLTGLPGSAKTNESLYLPKVVGFPGFMFSLPKNISPFCSKKGLIRSFSPIETPPDDTSKSIYFCWISSNFSATARFSSTTLSNIVNSTWLYRFKSLTICIVKLCNIIWFESLIWPIFNSIVSYFFNSFPDDKKATLSLFYFRTLIS